MTETEARAVLGVASDATPEAVRGAYRRLLRSTHPDVNGARDATARTVQLTAAYRVLRDRDAGSARTAEQQGSRGSDGDGATRPAGPDPGGPDPEGPGPDGPAPAGSTLPPHEGGAEPVTIPVAMVDPETIGIAAPAEETFLLLLEACHRLGEISYLDRSNGLVEAIVEFVDAPTSSVVLTTQGRASGVTEVVCSVEPLSGGEAPPSEAVARLMVDTLLGLGASGDRA